MTGFIGLKIALPARGRLLAGSVLSLLVAAMVVPGSAEAASCRSAPEPGMDWSQCNKRLLMLGHSVLDEANLSGADFTYTDLRNSSLKAANLEKTKLIRTSLAASQLQGANLTKAEAYRSNFSDVDAENATFAGAEMQRANFSRANLTGADFSKAELGRADFSGTTLTGTTFSMANLSRARFTDAVFEGPVDFEDAFLFLTRIEGFDLSAATGLEQSQIDIACGNDATKLPAGLTAPASWPCATDSEDEP